MTPLGRLLTYWTNDDADSETLICTCKGMRFVGRFNLHPWTISSGLNPVDLMKELSYAKSARGKMRTQVSTCSPTNRHSRFPNLGSPPWFGHQTGGYKLKKTSVWHLVDATGSSRSRWQKSHGEPRWWAHRMGSGCLS